MGQLASSAKSFLGQAKHPETGRLKMHDLKMQYWKMTDNFARNRRVWEMQDWKMTDHVN